MRSISNKLTGFKLPRQLSLRQIFLYSSIYIFVSIGCFSQIVSICRLFFNYPTLVSVETDNRVCENELPAFSFCSNLEPSIKEVHSSTKSIKEYFDSFNLSDQIFKFRLLTPDYEIINETTVTVDVRNNLIQTINSVYVCYTFNSLIKSKGKPIVLKRNEILAIRVDMSQTWNKSYLFVHDWYSIVNGWDWNSIDIIPGHHIALSFSKKRFNLLESPYFTDCIDYEKTTNFVSQHQCMTDCRIRTSLDNCNVIADDTNVEVNQPGRLARKKEDRKCTKWLNLDHYCFEVCPHPDCTKDYFKAIKFFTKPNGQNTSETFVNLKIPSEPQTIYNYKPKIETIEFLCYCASLTGLWFGFSIASIYYPIKRLIDWFDSRKSKQIILSFNKGKPQNSGMSQKMFYNISLRNPSLYLTHNTFGRFGSV